MLREIYIPLISALVGALIGAFSSILIVAIQSRAQNKRDRLKMVADLALEEYKQHYEMSKGTGPRTMLPLVVYLHYHMKLMQLLEEDKVTPETIHMLRAQRDNITGALQNDVIEAHKPTT